MPHPKIEILHEDNHLLVVVKPVNILSQADHTGDPDMLTLLKQDLKQRYQKPGNVYLGLVHRLDRPVGGAMVFAKTSKAASRLSDDIRTGRFRKAYLAVVHGVPAEKSGTLTHYLLKNEQTNTVAVAAPDTPQAKKAVLDYRVLEQQAGLSLIWIRLHTGRPHQIRVQLSAVGCPLYGDQKYGVQLNRPGQQIALWSCMIAFPHPVSKETELFYSLPPHEEPWSKWHTEKWKEEIRNEA